MIGLVTYAMGLRGPLAYNAASFIGTGLGTIFRFYAYRKWVFLAPAGAAAPAPLPDAPAFPDYPPWELDPAFLVPAEAAAQAPLPAPSYSSPWEREPGVPPGTRDSRRPPGAPRLPSPPIPRRRTPRQTAPAPAQSTRPAASMPARPAAPRSSGGGRHRKS